MPSKVIVDLSGNTYGYLKVISRGEDHITKSGQRKVTWVCKCLLCGKTKTVSSQNLKNGMTVSCGCYKKYKGKNIRNKKKCIICDIDFYCPPSSKTVTCSPICRSKYAKIRASERIFTDDTRRKISTKAKKRDMSKLQMIATESAKVSPRSGRFETNVNAKDWHLISPDGKHYQFRSLNFWLRENCRVLFGCEPDSRECNNVRSGLSGAKRTMLGKNRGSCTYKGWAVVPTDDDVAL